MARMKPDLKERLRDSIREAGKWIQENADQLVPETRMMRDMNIWIRFNSVDEPPEINVESTWYSDGMIRALFGEGKDDGSKGDMEKKDPGSL